ncbi:aryl-alcohol dehydrogenase-like predicted oxidoreductase [Streptomyces phaeochromogenes]|jgi:D-threo-aldose 1-dehydrogenase|uniref:aldo/keto reductase n=1 Tax=Streptomyces phaeochromogenes TaxID=1923 RepID=UPI0027941973|nr:aldo/keto reductase [Streptomyces phaeochromogenes]MDQ0951739.1 aryl-alcohol dehydrogenase-like predicted oxidoreductase [Streptomyces phaeochromogenes]
MRADDLVPLGRTGLQVSRLGLGLASLGGLFEPVPEEQAAATIDTAWELGVRLFDTAPVYGYGRSETRTGAGLASRPRDAYVLCTKVGRLIEPGGPDTQPIWADPPAGVGPRLDYSYAGVLRSVEESLGRLGLDRIDVLHVHDPDEDFGAAVGEAYRALADLRAEGVVGAVSLGVNHAPVAARFLREAAVPGPDCVLLAGRYNLLDQSGLDELLPLCVERGVAVMAAGVFQSGLLADPRPGAPHGYTSVPAELASRIGALRRICTAFDVPPLAAAVQFPLGHPAVTNVVVGARSAEEVAGTVSLLNHPVPGDFWRAVKERGLLPEGAPTPA